MQSENLLRTECGGGYDSDDGTGGGLRGSGGHQYSGYHHQYNVQFWRIYSTENYEWTLLQGQYWAQPPSYTL